MTRNFAVLAPAALVLAFVGYACTQGEVVEGPPTSGSAGAGNTVGSAGTTGAGNTIGAAGNTPSRGGTTGQAGNTPSRGGTTGQAGNTPSRGGTTGTGSTIGGAGTTGTAGSGNPAGTAGSTGACAPSFAVSADGYVQMPVTQGGCWTGYPFTYADTYGTMALPASFATCGAGCMLKLTGNIVPVAAPNYSYAGLGFNLGQTPAGGTTNTPVTPKGTGLTFNFTNATTGTGLVLRAQLTNGTTTWCTNITTSPAVVPYSSFTVNCFNTPPGAAYAKEPITQIQMNLAGGTTAGTMNITLNSVTEN